MSVSKFRIPRLTAAVLLLGGACGDNDNSSNETDAGAGAGDGDGGEQQTGKPAPTSAGVDVSAARIMRTAEAYCSNYAECEADKFTDNFTDQQDCVSQLQELLTTYVMSAGNDCGDATLDTTECLDALSCSAQEKEGACSVEDMAETTLCPDKTTKKSRGLRIPR